MAQSDKLKIQLTRIFPRRKTAKKTENHESVWITIIYGNVFDCQKRFLSLKRESAKR